MIVLKKVLALFLCGLLIVPFCGFVSENDVSAKAAVLYSPESEEFLFEKNSDLQLSMASTTKIMTALITLEYIETHGDSVVSITDEMVRVEGSSMGLQAGDKISLYNLCVGMLLSSGNDAANAASMYISKNRFSGLMNIRARELGMLSTSFVTPSGLDDEKHYTTAHDMALLGGAAIKNLMFKEIASSKSMTITYNLGKTTVRLSNHNKLLSMADGCIGIKTGFTKKSGRCLVSAVERDGATLVCVTLNAPDDWNDHIRLYEDGFAGVKKYTPVNTDFRLQTTTWGTAKLYIENNEEIIYFGDKTITEEVYLPRFIYYCKNKEFGRVDYLIDGKIISSRKIIAS